MVSNPIYIFTPEIVIYSPGLSPELRPIHPAANSIISPWMSNRHLKISMSTTELCFLSKTYSFIVFPISFSSNIILPIAKAKILGFKRKATSQVVLWYRTTAAGVPLLSKVDKRAISLKVNTGHSKQLRNSEIWVQ